MERIMLFLDDNPDRGSSAITMKIESICLALLLAGAGACGPFRHGSDTTAQSAPTTLVVDNQGFVDMNIYVLRNSQRLRIGTATGNQKTTLTIPPSLLTGITTLRFIADPIGGTRPSVSQEISVVPGDTVGLMIPPV
jgi:hypothetical protein